MKKILTLVIFIGCMGTLSAQILHRAEKVKGEQWSRIDQFSINLDTLPDLQFLMVRFDYSWSNKANLIFDIGDHLTWTLADSSSSTITANDEVHLLNYLYQHNWVFQCPISHVYSKIYHQNYLFKRREKK